MSDFNRSPGAAWRGVGTDRATAVDQGLRTYMIRVYNYMAVGVALTGVLAWLTYQMAGGDAISVVGGRVSASIAAELGTMKVTEQIDAMEMIAIDPVEYLVLPRITAATIMLPVLTIFSDLLAILGGMVVARISMGVSYNLFSSGLKLLFKSQDLIGGLMKTFVFGFIIALMGCYNGFATRGGAEGVGLATMRAVVASCLLILISNYLLATLIFRIIFAPSY